MGKNLNMNSMDKLFSGLTKTEVKQEQGSSQETSPQVDTEVLEAAAPASSKKVQKVNKTEKTHVCITIDTETLEKVRAISAKEGVYTRDIFNFALATVIDRYEELNGKISVKRRKKGDIRELLKM